MRLRVLCIGKTEHPQMLAWIREYMAKLPRHWNAEWLELPDAKNKKSATPEVLKREEAKIFETYCLPGDLTILLDEKGTELTSREFSAQILRWQDSGAKQINIVIGGAFGFDADFRGRATMLLSLSKMTFTHQMVRLFLAEQLFRADQILRGKPYHND